MEGLENLTDKEKEVLEPLKDRDGSIGEDEYHMISEVIDNSGHGLGFSYRLIHWHTLDERFKSRYGATFFSQELHDIIEGLIKKGHVIRDPDNPIKIQYSGGQDDNRN